MAFMKSKHNMSGMEIDDHKEQEHKENAQVQQIEEASLEEDPQHDHERAFFDSADWALGKGQKPKGPLEALRPKLQPTPQQQVRSRKSAYAPADDDGEDGGVAAAEDPVNTE
ncbi:hypothetical protein ACLOJK_013972 [Asimina triloba]